MKRTMIDFWVGLFIALGIVALLFLALKVSSQSSLPASSTYTVTANFENIGGLKVRAPVKSAGVVVGRVAAITLDPQRYVASVTMKLDDRYHFSRDTSAEILTAGLLGEQYVGLEPGADEKMLMNGDRITITSSAIVLEQLISRFLFSKADEGGNAHTEK
ncbi:outer membrane lipid asymmetry maintenance protein MlaD [Jeongeupia naejangsanensis]|uniref:Outer membrane lipid asymmetry maintenance protein MlaD n=1 Tax=Jeongeupia naejangsanensis TaxID=613195 RepID=A0ABS2BK30_9NEIS|nr:outer membrane lipid asymmetry maintenance protein MlaD [Jeongeupia naejangsanensis]MBM3115948.1 outer membrane lipid asymmetry maintenance protein MlaD [Jeongeupia naejangsanensis]